MFRKESNEKTLIERKPNGHMPFQVILNSDRVFI